MYRELTGGMDRVATMIWRTQNDGPEEDRDEPAAQRLKELSSIADELLALAQALARQTDELIGALNGSAGTMPGSNGRPLRPAGSVSGGARLLVTQMAVAGSSRAGIASRLQPEFGIEDPSAILDEAGL